MRLAQACPNFNYCISNAPHTQGIATLVDSSQEDGAQFSEVDLGDTEQVILRGVNEEQHQQHCQELARLQAL